MSRIGKKPITVPSNVTVTITGSKVGVKGPKGELVINIRPEVRVSQEGTSISVELVSAQKGAGAYWGTTRALIANMVKGVSEGFEKKLELVGVGYRAKSIPGGVSLTLGFSHPIEYPVPMGIEVQVPEQSVVIVKGADKQLVGLVAAQIRKFRKPEPYKGKGIKYAGEVVRRKAGKSAKA